MHAFSTNQIADILHYNDNSQYCTISRAITTLSLHNHSILLLQPYQLVILQKFEYHQSVEKLIM